MVRTAPLAALVRDWIAKWNVDRPPTGGRFAAGGCTTEVTPVRAVEWLVENTGVSESTIRNIVDERYRTTSLSIADAIVSDGLGRPDFLHDGTLGDVIERSNVSSFRETAAQIGISVADLLAIDALAKSSARALAVA